MVRFRMAPCHISPEPAELPNAFPAIAQRTPLDARLVATEYHVAYYSLTYPYFYRRAGLRDFERIAVRLGAKFACYRGPLRMGEGRLADRARRGNRGNMASVGKLRAPVFRQCGPAIESQAQQSLRVGAPKRSRLAHPTGWRKPSTGCGSKRRPVSPRQRRARRRSKTPQQMERGAMLHVRYAEWYANLFKLEIKNTSGNGDWPMSPIKA